MICVEGQSDSVVQDIENMVRSYIEKVYWFLYEAARLWIQLSFIIILWNILKQ